MEHDTLSYVWYSNDRLLKETSDTLTYTMLDSTNLHVYANDSFSLSRNKGSLGIEKI